VGMNIFLYNISKGQDIHVSDKTWDASRQGDDRRFASYFDKINLISSDYYWEFKRPKKFIDFLYLFFLCFRCRFAMRYLRLWFLLVSNKDYWVYLSY